MANISVQLEKRTLLGRKSNQLRRQGIVPVNIFGKKIKSEAAQMKASDFQKLFSKAGETSIIYFTLDTEKLERPCLISNVQYHPLTDAIIHVDLHQVDLKEKVKAEIPVELEGVSPAVTNENAAIVTQVQTIEVEALPTDLPEKFTIDLSTLEKVGDRFTVSQLDYDKSKVTIELDLDTTIVSAQAQQAEEEVVVAPAEETTVPVKEGEPEPATAAPVTEKAKEELKK